MKILYVSGYDAWTQISQGKKPSHHLFGIHQLIDHYENRSNGSVFGIIKKNVIVGCEYGEVDFYLWESVKKDVLKHLKFMLTIGNKYDIIYDCLNRCSIWVGIFKKIGLFKPLVITTMHHPPYRIGLNFSHSDAYVFFNEEFRQIGIKACKRKLQLYFVNEWYPDIKWYDSLPISEYEQGTFFIDNGKTERDRLLMIQAADNTKNIISYPGDETQVTGFARTYKMDLSDYTKMALRLKSCGCIVVPVKKFKKPKIGPLGITSFLDCIALKLPIITSDNTCFSNDVDKFQLGLSYKTGDLKDLEQSLFKMKNDKKFYNECCHNMVNYRQERTIEHFGENVKHIINCTILSKKDKSNVLANSFK